MDTKQAVETQKAYFIRVSDDVFCDLSLLGKAKGVLPNRRPGAGVSKAVWQDNATPATPATLLVPKQYRYLSFPWIHWPCVEGGVATWTIARLPYTCPAYVAPLERTLHRYSIVSCRQKDADEEVEVASFS